MPPANPADAGGPLGREVAPHRRGAAALVHGRRGRARGSGSSASSPSASNDSAARSASGSPSATRRRGNGRRTLAEGPKLTAAGLIVAGLGSYGIRSAVATFVLADVTPPSWQVLAGVMLVIAVVAAAACVIPARRAARTSLLTALRD